MWNAFLTGGLSLLFLVLLGWACNKTLDNIGMWDGFVRLLVDGPEMHFKWSSDNEKFVIREFWLWHVSRVTAQSD